MPVVAKILSSGRASLSNVDISIGKVVGFIRLSDRSSHI